METEENAEDGPDVYAIRRRRSPDAESCLESLETTWAESIPVMRVRDQLERPKRTCGVGCEEGRESAEMHTSLHP